MSRFFRPRTLAVIVMVLILSATVYAFAAANTVPATSAGDGSGVISGYTITSVHYTLDSSNPANISQVAFTIAPASAGQVYVSLNGGTSWTSCTNSSGSVSCLPSGATALAATSLRVVAAE